MIKLIRKLTFIAVYITFAISNLFPQDVLRPYRTNVPPVLDGRLDDPVWKRAPTITGFKTFTPDFGIDMVEKTVVYSAYDSENMYFGFKCYDSQPDKIKTTITSRDNVRADDWMCINLDSFYDQQAGYAFYMNPAGIQGDSRYTSVGEDLSFDAVWYSKGVIDSEGFTIEVKIPFKSIRIANTNPVNMGVIFERKISRRSEQGTHPALNPDRSISFLMQTKKMVFK